MPPFRQALTANEAASYFRTGRTLRPSRTSRPLYFACAQGRLTGVDPLRDSGRAETPQTWNRYAYALTPPATSAR